MLDTYQKHDERLSGAFREHVEANEFPCVGAKAAMARGTLKTMVCHDIASAWDDLRIHKALLDWSQEYTRAPGIFRSLAVIFAHSRPLTEERFEELMWERLQSLADKDEWLGQSYDDAVSADPSDPHFGLSFGGEAYFVVGMHPGASRPARQFESPVMVFNLHDQFEKLRADQKYERMREAILQRDKALAGDINPMLARHGETSEAAQYSGRIVGDAWQCPFKDKRA